jgi:hypothetical protein
VGHISHPSTFGGLVGVGDCANFASELQSNPKTNPDKRWHGYELRAKQHIYARLGEHQNVSPENAGNRARCP